ncbi:hypothetical protein MTX20_11575 [Bradyrhizobium sp. ISRA435]|nr:hypothetical protein MTX20_11575 [Bradyrhizobium sp. ISRA435]
MAPGSARAPDRPRAAASEPDALVRPQAALAGSGAQALLPAAVSETAA